MKRFISVVILATLSFGAHASLSTPQQSYNEQQCRIFDDSQIETLRKAYHAGADLNYGWTLAAIAWQESSSGKKLINPAGPAYGVFQNLLSTVARREGVTSKTEKRILAKRLVNEFDFAVENAVKELDYWKGRHRGNRDRMMASYYAGYNWKHPAGQKYKDTINKKIKFLQRNGCITRG